MAQIRINTRTHTKEKPYLINSQFLQNWEGKKSEKGEQNMCMYVSEICAKGIFVLFPWWLKNVKNRSKIALFSNERHFEIWFPKKIIITFFGRKISKLHKKETILHVTISFFLKQRETRTSSGPITHPLTHNLHRNVNEIFPNIVHRLKHRFCRGWFACFPIESLFSAPLYRKKDGFFYVES